MSRLNGRIARLEKANAPKPKFRVVVYEKGKPETARLPDGETEAVGDFTVFVASDVAAVG
ncbi:MAG TPA: hypothetical protein VN222_06830 [Novosphingobium sp.]|nr:hypothetical protein [Novosphingobium sp.]